jgi:hypothetical protein
MAEMLLINPKKRRKARRSNPARSAAQRRATAKLVAMNRRRGRGRRRNPGTAVPAMNPMRRRVARRANPIRAVSRRRRSNPIGGGRFGVGLIMRQVQDSLIQGGGAVAMDLIYGQIQRFLPTMLQRTPGSIGLGDATKAVITVALGHFLSPLTRGMSRRAATGALTVQAHGIIAGLLPTTMTLGYAQPGRVVQGNSRIGPNRAITGQMGAYTRPGATPLLNAYAQPGAMTPMLNGAGRARMREGVAIR